MAHGSSTSASEIKEQVAIAVARASALSEIFPELQPKFGPIATLVSDVAHL
jgi:hypothetical protein